MHDASINLAICSSVSHIRHTVNENRIQYIVKTNVSCIPYQFMMCGPSLYHGSIFLLFILQQAYPPPIGEWSVRIVKIKQNLADKNVTIMSVKIQFSWKGLKVTTAFD